MNEHQRQQAMQDWLATQPKSVQELAAEFPLDTTFDVRGEVLHLIGYNEDDMLIVSPIVPHKDYEAATKNTKYLCAKHCRVRARR